MSGQHLEKKKRSLLPLILGILLAAIIAVVAVSTSSKPELEEPDPTVLVNDGVQDISIIPAEGVTVSDIDRSFFARIDGIALYLGRDYDAIQGIDVSTYQGNIDWERVSSAGIRFAFMRIGYRGCTTGEIREDDTFRSNLSAAQAQGIQVGIYFFSQALTAEEGQEEAQWVLSELNGCTLQLPVMFDWETVEKEGSRSVDVDYSEVMTPAAVAFCQAMEEGGYDAGVYFNRQQCYHQYDMSQIKDYSFWLSDPQTRPNCYYAYTFWQYTFRGKVDGISTIVDRDLMLVPTETSNR